MPPPLRIALISEHASPLATIGGVDAGGQNIYVAQVARSLAHAGHEVDVFTRRDDEHLADVVPLSDGVQLRHVTAGPARFVPKEQLLGHMPAFSRAARDIVEGSRRRYDVVHANFFMSGLVAMRLKKVFRIPLVMTFHALGLVRREHQKEADAFPAQRIDIERQLVQQSDRVIAECPQDADDLVRLYGASSERITTVPCGVDMHEFFPASRLEARRALGLADDEFVILQLGRMVPRKGVENVIRALAFLPSRVKARLVVVGGESADPNDGRTPEITRLRAVARECGVSERVSFTGQRQREHLHSFYNACNVFVTTPWYEPFGITPLEAMACARPVVGSEVGGIKHSVVDGSTGFLVPPRDPQALADRLLRLHDAPELADEMGRAGLRRVRTQFTWDLVARDLADVYQEVSARREARRDAREAVLQAVGARA
jgi:D-inositol-3-phosphate glycosyltransferase